jgi:hypothetical protein
MNLFRFPLPAVNLFEKVAKTGDGNRRAFEFVLSPKIVPNTFAQLFKSWPPEAHLEWLS